MRDSREIGKDDLDTRMDGYRGCFGEAGAEGRRVRDRRTCAGGCPTQGAFLGVTAAAACRVEVSRELLGLAIEMMEQNVGARQGGAGAEEYGQEKEGEEPLPHGRIIPSLTDRRRSAPRIRARRPCGVGRTLS
jgi:hypothetical protein